MSIRLVALFSCLIALHGTALAATTYSLRAPQIPVQGGALQGFFIAEGQSLDVQRDQLDAQLMQMYLNTNSTYTIQIECAAKDDGISLGLYDGSTLTPWLAQLFPASAGPGWFAVASFRPSPARVVVNLFDANASLQGTTTFLGGNRQAIGFYAQGPNGVIYSQDSRNPGGAAQVLFFAGISVYSGAMWIAFEASARAAGADDDFDDAVLLLEQNIFVGPVQHTSWGSLKKRFR